MTGHYAQQHTGNRWERADDPFRIPCLRVGIIVGTQNDFVYVVGKIPVHIQMS